MDKNFWLKLDRPILALAPMAGITDSSFRAICKKYGADVTYSEMASASALYFKPGKTIDLVRFGTDERPYVVQLFGKDPDHFAKAARIITQRVKPDGIDINFGCPAKKVFGHGSGCALMPQKKLAREIIRAVCENSDLPVSIKIRAGLNSRPVRGETRHKAAEGALPQERDGASAFEFVKNTADLPYSAIMVHGRTYEGGFAGPVDFKICEEIKKLAPDKTVLANGGINTPEEAKNILKRYPALDGLGIARGAWGQPFIFRQIKEIFRHGEYRAYEFSDVRKLMLEHARLIHSDKGRSGLFEIRKHMSWYVRGVPGAGKLRRNLVMADSLREIADILAEPKCA